MNDLLAFVSQPLIIVLAALAFFILRTVLHARRLKSAAKDPELAKLMFPEAGRDVLRMHKESLNHAKGETAGNIASARRLLHNYAAVFKRSKQQKA